jgi:NADH-quinone oxidoreductase subunit I
MVVTARNFVGSYHDPDRLPTIEYPEKRQKLPENSRSFPMLVFDGDDPEEGLRCVACKICEKECPPQCIYIVAERDERGKAVRHPKIFDLDISVCMQCQICVEVCPFDSIKMDAAFEMAGGDRFGSMLLRKQELAKPDSYFHSIRPSEAVGSDARAEHLKKPAGHSEAASGEATRKAA